VLGKVESEVMCRKTEERTSDERVKRKNAQKECRCCGINRSGAYTIRKN